MTPPDANRTRPAAAVRLALVGVLAWAGGAACDRRPNPDPVPGDRPVTQPARVGTQVNLQAGPAGSPATRPAGRLAPPTLADLRPVDYPGLHNVVAYAAGVYSGSVPEGADGFESLRRLGVRTVISVDGAEPDLAPAKERGLRYVHLPITYGGIPEARKLEIARAVRDLPKPVFVHCHHGKHRSAGAAGAALVSLGELTPAQAVDRMKVSGTAPDYKGLYACAAGATKVLPAVLDAVSNDFPEVLRPQGTVKTMVETDVAVENLKAAQRAGWRPPADHPDLSPAAEAGRLADLLRHLKDDRHTAAQPPAYLAAMLESSRLAAKLEQGLIAPAAPREELDLRFKAVLKSCKDCHQGYRD